MKWVQALLSIIFARLSVFAAFSVTFGGVSGLLSAPWSDKPWLFFVFGSCLPSAPLLLYFSSAKSLQRSIETWKGLQDEGIITKRQFSILRETAVEWYRQRWFGSSFIAGPDEQDENEDT